MLRFMTGLSTFKNGVSIKPLLVAGLPIENNTNPLPACI
jgi:hypothetical protein